MSLQDKIAKRLLAKHGHVLSRTGQSGWWTDTKSRVETADREIMDSTAVKVKFASKAKLMCEVAGDERSQTVGLQKYASMPDGYGMIFTYTEPKKVSFHMGSVAFPIDIIFVDSNGRINRIVDSVEPGTRGTWGMSHVSAVIEANAGFCRSKGIELGDMVDIQSHARMAAQTISIDEILRQLYHGFREYVLWPDGGLERAMEGGPLLFHATDTISKTPTQATVIITIDGLDKYVKLIYDPRYPVAPENQRNIPEIVSSVQLTISLLPNNDFEVLDKDGINANTVNADAFGGYIGRKVGCFINLLITQEGYEVTYDSEGRPDMGGFTRSPFGVGVNVVEDESKIDEQDGDMQVPVQPRKLMNNKIAQEFYPSEPRKDINPKMMEPSGISPEDRFKGHDLVDVQTEDQPLDGANFDTQIGFDPSKNMEDEVGPIRPL